MRSQSGGTEPLSPPQTPAAACQSSHTTGSVAVDDRYPRFPGRIGEERAWRQPIRDLMSATAEPKRPLMRTSGV